MSISSNYNMVSDEVLTAFKQICGSENVITSQKDLEPFAHDETEDLKYYPEVVLLPSTRQQISEILILCNTNLIPVTTRGAGTGLSGGALPIMGGVVLSMQKFDKIIDIDLKNLQATVETGVITQVFQEEVAKHGLFYPPDPSSRGACFMGGNIAENAGGPKAAKYGVTKDFILNLEVVLATGEIIWTGSNTLKNATGYNLTQLIIGSEGTLAIVTKAVIKLIPLPMHSLVMLAPFTSATKACEAVSAIYRAGITPSCLEFMEKNALKWASDYLNIPLNISHEIEAHLLIEVDGNHLETLFADCEKINEVLSQFEVEDILFADTAEQKDALWKLRRNIAHAVKSKSIYKEEDTVVPRAFLPQLLSKVKEVGVNYGFESVCYGHAGDGNLHINIVKGDLDDETWNSTINHGISEIFAFVKSLKGTISGEHGIGLVQKKYMPIIFSEFEMNLMKGIKKVFDPNSILNPGKIFPD